MNNMDRDSIIFFKNKYDNEEYLYTRGDEKELRERLRKNNYLTKEDLIQIIKWKFQGRLTGRQKRLLKFIEGIDDQIIKNISKLAFKTKDDETRIKLFCVIKGVGTALTSVILAFYDPNNYGIMDIHSWREMFGKEPKDLFTSNRHLIRFLNKLREISNEVNLPCRDIEKALFKKNLCG